MTNKIKLINRSNTDEFNQQTSLLVIHLYYFVSEADSALRVPAKLIYNSVRKLNVAGKYVISFKMHVMNCHKYLCYYPRLKIL